LLRPAYARADVLRSLRLGGAAMSEIDEALAEIDQDIAAEQMAWCRRIGQKPREILVALGALVPAKPTWPHVLDALTAEAKTMRLRARHPARNRRRELVMGD
jgi:hypothetical protein